MAISGKYYIRKRIPLPTLVHPEMADNMKDMDISKMNAPMPDFELAVPGPITEHFFEGEMIFDFDPQPDGTLKGTAGGDPINSGFYTGDEFFKVDYPAGPGRWEIWARVDSDGNVSGMVSVGGGKGAPNLVYGKKLD